MHDRQAPRPLDSRLDELQDMIKIADRLVVAAPNGVGYPADERTDRARAVQRNEVLRLILTCDILLHGRTLAACNQ